VELRLPGPGDVLHYTIRLENPGPALAGVRVTDTLPVELEYQGDLWASAGTGSEAGGVITWTGAVAASEPVTITFSARLAAQVTAPRAIVNTALVDDGLGNVWQRSATVVVNGRGIYLPLINAP
jgi:uncharacterized repeat protein (TIGR01451 family)